MHRRMHTFSQNDMYESYDLERLKFKKTADTRRKLKTIYKYARKRNLVAKIFLTLMKMIVDDMVENGSTFHLPTKTIAMFTWSKLQDEAFTRAYQSGKFDDVDYLQTNFTIYLPIFKYYFKNKFIEKKFIVDERRKIKIKAVENTGYKYC